MKLETNKDLAFCRTVAARRALLDRNSRAFETEFQAVCRMMEEIRSEIPGTYEYFWRVLNETRVIPNVRFGTTFMDYKACGIVPRYDGFYSK